MYLGVAIPRMYMCIHSINEYKTWLTATEKNTPIIPGCFLRTQLGKALVAQHSPTPMNTELLPKTRVQCIVVVVRGRFCWCYPMMRRLLFVPLVDDEDIDVWGGSRFASLRGSHFSGCLQIRAWEETDPRAVCKSSIIETCGQFKYTKYEQTLALHT